MSLGIQCLDFDCLDPRQVALFWKAPLGWRFTYESDEEYVLEPPEGSPQDGVAADLLFLKVPDVKTVKNRLHLDLRPDDQGAEVQRLLDSERPVSTSVKVTPAGWSSQIPRATSSAC